jgi:hypothetical protein
MRPQRRGDPPSILPELSLALRSSFRRELGFELDQDRKVLAAKLYEQPHDCFEMTAVSGNFSGTKFGGENGSVNCPGTRLERVRGSLDRLDFATRHCAFEG